ncbi:restriction endonuclease subunit S [endosymbiont of Lamellibrachia barhami]|uniref:restriction endonuclease subunit S n=1 Tax=endosymbiont of Lamellibrachia barhami TaxID=205975 RepID=UPI0015B32BF7|nr:restriction endonuclease subunit S [endosymbiont of Lamellibrachia barhami]
MVYEGNQKLGDLFVSRREKGKAGLPTLSVTLNDGLVNREILERKTDTNLSESEHLLIKQGDIVYNMMRMWQGASGLAENDGLVSPAYIVLAPKENVDSLFAAYLFKTQRLIYLFWAYSYGLTSDRLRLYFNDFSRIPVDVPRIEEQTKIAQILSTWDKAIETTEKLIKNSKAQKKALMQQLLTGKKRFPGFEGKWKEVQLSIIVDITMGSSPKSESYNRDKAGLPLIQGNADIRNRFSSPRVYTSQITKECSIGDVLLSVRAPVGMVSVSKHHACIGRGIAAITAKTSSSTRFIYQLLLAHEPKWIRLSQGSTFDAVNGADIRKFRVFIPNEKDEQLRTAVVLDDQDKETKNLEKQLFSLKGQKKALMQQLLTGKRRVILDKSEIDEN